MSEFGCKSFEIRPAPRRFLRWRVDRVRYLTSVTAEPIQNGVLFKATEPVRKEKTPWYERLAYHAAWCWTRRQGPSAEREVTR